MAKIEEIRVLLSYDLRKVCIEYNWFTNGTVVEYEQFLNKVGSKKHITAEKILELAEDIVKYSELEDGMDLEAICFIIARACRTHFKITE